MAIRDTPGNVVAGGGTKQAIRDAAVKLFVAKGFEPTSLREVADAVGITKASLYYHYSSKLDLLVAIIDPILDHLRTLVADIADAPYDAEGRRSVLRAYVRGMMRHRDAGALILRDTAAIFNAMGDRYPELWDAHQALRVWLAGPEPTAEAKLRAAAALEILSVALVSMEMVPDAPDELVESTLLDAATGVLEPHAA